MSNHSNNHACCGGHTPSNTEHHNHEVDTKQTQKFYVCPMHPEVRSPKPGDCPKCGMHLVIEEQSPEGALPVKTTGEHGQHDCCSSKSGGHHTGHHSQNTNQSLSQYNDVPSGHKRSYLDTHSKKKRSGFATSDRPLDHSASLPKSVS